jgi:hypothetical protein
MDDGVNSLELSPGDAVFVLPPRRGVRANGLG